MKIFLKGLIYLTLQSYKDQVIPPFKKKKSSYLTPILELLLNTINNLCIGLNHELNSKKHLCQNADVISLL